MTEQDQPNTEWTNDQGDAAASGPEDATTQARREELDAKEEQLRAGFEQFSETAVKIAQDTGFAVAGFAGLVGEKAKAFYEDQKQQYAETHPEADKDPGAKEFLTQLSDRLNRLVDDLTRGFKDMAERGRESFDKDAGGAGDSQPSPADKPSMVNTDADLREEPVASDVPPPVAEDIERDDL